MENVDQLKSRARGVVLDQIDARSSDLGNAVGTHAGNLRSMSGSLRDQGQGSTANLVDMAADRLDRVSQYLTQTDGERIVHDVEDFARNQAVVTAAVGLIGGFLAARVLRAGATQRYSTYGTNRGGTAGYENSGYGRDRGYTGTYDDVSV